MRILFALALLVHGVAHTVGYLKATGPRWDRILGQGWFFLAIGFASAAVAAAAGIEGWPWITVGLAIASALMCIVKLPETVLGLVANVALVGALALTDRL